MIKSEKAKKAQKYASRFVGEASDIKIIKNPWSTNPPQKVK